MRTKDKLLAMDEVSILFQYLYINEDHTLIYKNVFGHTMRVKMNEKLILTSTCDAFLDSPPKNVSEDFTISFCLNLIALLKATPQTNTYPGSKFKNYWDEIKTITLMQKSLNI